MAVQNFDQEWRSASEQTSYPFTAPTSQVPSDFLIDLQVAFGGRTEIDAVLTSIEYEETPDQYSLRILLGGTVAAFSGVPIDRRLNGESRVGKKIVVVDGAYLMILQPGPSWDDPTWGAVGSWGIEPSAIILPSQVARQPQTILRIFIDGETIPPEDEWPRGVSQKLMAGYNLEFTEKPSEFAPALLPRDQALIWSLNAAPGRGAGYPPAPDTSIDYVATFNGMGGDAKGNMNLTGQDCLRATIPELDGAPIPNTLQLASDCQACCPCGEYQKVSRAIGRRSAKIKDYCDEIAATLLAANVAYEEGVGVINARRPPLTLVRNVRAIGAHVLFTVSNVSNLPVYCYVGIDLISYEGAGSPLPFAVDTTASAVVTEVDQAGYASIDATINAHRLTLPPVNFSSQENPLASFPITTFSPLTAANLLVVVGGVSTSDAFPPIAPGATVEVSIVSPSINATLLGMLTSPADYDTDAEREAIVAQTMGAKKPQLRFRSVAVVGASHSYPCTGETYEVKIQEFDADDVMRQVCDTNLERRYQAVEVLTRDQIGGRP